MRLQQPGAAGHRFLEINRYDPRRIPPRLQPRFFEIPETRPPALSEDLGSGPFPKLSEKLTRLGERSVRLEQPETAHPPPFGDRRLRVGLELRIEFVAVKLPLRHVFHIRREGRAQELIPALLDPLLRDVFRDSDLSQIHRTRAVFAVRPGKFRDRPDRLVEGDPVLHRIVAAVGDQIEIHMREDVLRHRGDALPLVAHPVNLGRVQDLEPRAGKPIPRPRHPGLPCREPLHKAAAKCSPIFRRRIPSLARAAELPVALPVLQDHHEIPVAVFLEKVRGEILKLFRDFSVKPIVLPLLPAPLDRAFRNQDQGLETHSEDLRPIGGSGEIAQRRHLRPIAVERIIRRRTRGIEPEFPQPRPQFQHLFCTFGQVRLPGEMVFPSNQCSADAVADRRNQRTQPHRPFAVDRLGHIGVFFAERHRWDRRQ